MSELSVILADDHGVLRQGMRSFLEEQTHPRIRVVAEADRGDETVDLVQEHGPDLVLLDVSMPGMDGLDTTGELRRRGINARILILTQHDQPTLLKRLLEAGANGYILKSARGDELISAIRAVAAGGTYIDPSLAGSMLSRPSAPGESVSPEEVYETLTPREREVLKLVAEGLRNKAIAARLRIAVKTVMTHRFNLMEKLGIKNQSKLVQFAMRVGLIPKP